MDIGKYKQKKQIKHDRIKEILSFRIILDIEIELKFKVIIYMSTMKIFIKYEIFAFME